MSENMTKVANLVNPQVVADMISGRPEKAIKFAPIAKVDDSLVGVPGDEVTVPRYAYIGDAEIIPEGVAMGTTVLTATSGKMKIKKAGKAVEITDEAMLSAYGDPLGESSRQLMLAIAGKMEDECIEALNAASLALDKKEEAISYGGIVDAVDLLNEEEEQEKYIFIHPKQAKTLRKDPDFLDRNKFGGEVMATGAIGMLAGCNVIMSRRVPNNSGTFTNFIVAKDALTIFTKKEATVEADRDILANTTVLAADQHFGVMLVDESKAVKITFKA